MTYRVAYIVGSASTDSLNRRLMGALMVDAPDSMEFVEVPIVDLPFYRREFDEDMPAEGVELHRVLGEADALIIVTPEYNRSIPGVLKNALDWASRPPGSNPLAGKPVLLVSGTPGKVGGAVAQSHLRAIISIFNVHLMTRPELYIQVSKADFDADGRVTTEGTQEFLTKAVAKFGDYIAHVVR